MKKLLVCLSLLLLNASLANAQHFIDADLIRTKRAESYKNSLQMKPFPEQASIAIVQFYGKPSVSFDILVGFDKVEYAYGEVITVTLKRESTPQSPDSLDVRVSGEGIFEGNLGNTDLRLGKNVTKRITVSNVRASDDSKAYISIHNYPTGIPMNYESIVYQIDYTNYFKKIAQKNNALQITPSRTPSDSGMLKLNGIGIFDHVPNRASKRIKTDIEESQKVRMASQHQRDNIAIPTNQSSFGKKTLFLENQSTSHPVNIISPDLNESFQPQKEEPLIDIIISGSLKYQRNSNISSPGYQGIRHWLLGVFQADTESDANNLNTNSNYIYNEYPIVATSSNGNFMKTVSISKPWYSVIVYPIRQLNTGHINYIGYTVDSVSAGYWEAKLYNLIYSARSRSSGNRSIIDTLKWTNNPTTFDGKVLEGFRRCFEIAYRLDSAMSYAVINNLKINNESIPNAQTVNIITSGISFPEGEDGAYAAIYDASTKENDLFIGYNDYYQSDGVVLHEYGHTLQFAMNNFTLYPEQGGLHYMDGAGHPNNAFSEGWANYWACAVTNRQLYNEGLTNFQLNLGTTTSSYLYSRQPSASSYLPNSITSFDGVENEAMVAAALWQMKLSSGNLAVWNGMLASYTSRKPRNIMEYFAASSSLQTTFYNSGRALNLGFGNQFYSPNSGSNLQSQINALTTANRPLMYLADGTYNVSPQLAIGEKTVGIYGMSSKSTIIRGVGNNNVVQIANRSNNNDWLKLADLQITNGNFGIDAGFDGAGASGQPRVSVHRCFVKSNLRGMCFAGDAVLRNSVIDYTQQQGVGVMLISSGTTRKVYVYNNVLNNCTPSILFRNRSAIEGRMGNNIINSITPFGFSALTSGGNPILPTAISFTNNGLLTTVPPGYVSSSSSYIGSPNFVSANFFNPQNSQYPDGGIQIPSYDPIFNDRAIGSTSGQSGSGTYDYGASDRNWVGLYGGQTAYFGGSFLLPSSIAEPLAIVYSVLEHDVWGGTVEILDSNVTVKSGAQLTILSNTTISLATGKRIIVEPGAKLIANGNFDSPIVFKRKDASQAWDKIALYGDSCQFSYCTFEGGTYNAAIYGRGTAFNNCTFKNGWVGNDSYWAATGVRSSFTMNTCSFQNNRTGAIVSYADAVLSNCTIQNNTSVGLYVWNSTATTDWATVQNNVTDANEGNRGGVELRNASVLNFEPNKYNRIWNNLSHEVYLDQPSRLYAGSSSSSRGNNSIKDVVNGYNANGYYIHNYTLSIGYEDEELVGSAPAQYNYWGGAPNAGMFLGSVDYSNPLSSDPTDVLPQRTKNNGDNANVQQDDVGILPIDTIRVDVDGWVALKQRMAALRASIGQNEHRKVGVKMLGELYALMTFDRENKTGERNNVDALLSKWSSRLKHHVRGSAAGEAELAITFGGEASMVAEIDAQLKRENYTEALTKLNDYEAHILNKDHKAICLMSRLALQECAGEYVAALQTVQTLKSLIPDDGLANHYDAPSYDIVEARLNDLIGNGSPTTPNIAGRNAQTGSLSKTAKRL